jgi:hypothetical protein
VHQHEGLHVAAAGVAPNESTRPIAFEVAALEACRASTAFDQRAEALVEAAAVDGGDEFIEFFRV